MRRALIFFTRIPAPDTTKTRLRSLLHKVDCAELQLAFIKDIYATIRTLDVDIIVTYADDGCLNVLKHSLPNATRYSKQIGKSLGEKMANAFKDALLDYDSVVLMGSDVPLVKKSDLELAYEILEKKDVVIAPTYDGGYYLIGMKSLNRAVFQLSYSTDTVYSDTIKLISESNLSFGEGEIVLDIDDEEDFSILVKTLAERSKDDLIHTRSMLGKLIKRLEHA